LFTIGGLGIYGRNGVKTIHRMALIDRALFIDCLLIPVDAYQCLMSRAGGNLAARESTKA
jgi:hypothetical protein